MFQYGRKRDTIEQIDQDIAEGERLMFWGSAGTPVE